MYEPLFLFQYNTGNPAPEVGTPSASVMVAVKVLFPVAFISVRGVYDITGGVLTR